MTDAELTAIEARCAAATDGPWRVCNHAGGYLGIQCNTRYGYVAECGDQLDEQHHENATFIAHARTDIPALLAEVRRLRTENEQIQKWAQTTLDYADERIAVLREGIEHAARLTGHGRMVAILNNLLAGREWSYAEVDNG